MNLEKGQEGCHGGAPWRKLPSSDGVLIVSPISECAEKVAIGKPGEDPATPPLLLHLIYIRDQLSIYWIAYTQLDGDMNLYSFVSFTKYFCFLNLTLDGSTLPA